MHNVGHDWFPIQISFMGPFQFQCSVIFLLILIFLLTVSKNSIYSIAKLSFTEQLPALSIPAMEFLRITHLQLRGFEFPPPCSTLIQSSLIL